MRTSGNYKIIQSSNRYFYLLAFALFLGISSPILFSEGMFMDGLMYATISNNLAKGLGDIWHLHFSQTLYGVFNEHPPLAFAIQSVFYRIFGASIYVEKCYSFMTFVVSSYLLFRIWSLIFPNNAQAWVVIVLWVLMPLVTWCAANNLLENTMGVFVLSSFLFYLKSQSRNVITYLVLAGLMLVFAFLSKGFTCLFVWSVPFWFWLFLRKKTFTVMLFECFMLVLFTVLPLFVLFLLVPDSYDSIQRYVHTQVIKSLESVQTVSTRFEILLVLFNELLIPSVIGFLIWIFGRKSVNGKNKQLNLMYLFTCIGMSGVLPIMISLKQSGFYILCALPFFALAAGTFLSPFVEVLLLKFSKKGFMIFKTIVLVLCLAAIGIFVLQFGRIGRDTEKLELMHACQSILPKNAIIGIPKSLYDDWSLKAYFARYSNISLDCDEEYPNQFYLSTEVVNLASHQLVLESPPYLLYQILSSR